MILLHTDAHGKALFRKEIKGDSLFKVSVEMISPKELVMLDS